MITEITPEAPQASPASLPTLDPAIAKKLRQTAAKWRAKENRRDLATTGHVVIYCGGAVGWTSDISKDASGWVPGCLAVPADDGPIYLATGGTAAHGAKKWEARS